MKEDERLSRYIEYYTIYTMTNIPRLSWVPPNLSVIPVEDNQPECGLLWPDRPERGAAGELGQVLQSVSPPAALPARQDHPHRPSPSSLAQQEGWGGRLPR